MPNTTHGTSRYKNGARRRKDRARLKALRLPCAICGQDIDYSLPAQHPYSFEVDEIEPVSMGGALSWANYQPAHRVCNQIKGNRRNFFLSFLPYRGKKVRWVYKQSLHAGGAPLRPDEGVAWAQTSQDWK